MFRMLCGLAVVSMLSVVALGCGGLSTEDATLRCKEEREGRAFFFTDELFKQCVSCYEECGDDCTAVATTPASYTCESQAEATGSGGSGS